MRNNLKMLAVSAGLILLPMIYGLIMYDKLPMQMATHFGLNNNPDGYMAKPFAVIGLPLIMLVAQIVMIWGTQLKHDVKPMPIKLQRIMLMIIPAIAIMAYLTTILFNLGYSVNVWRWAMLTIGFLFILMGNYLPTVSYEQRENINFFNNRISASNWRLMVRKLGQGMFVIGILMIISIFFNPVVSVLVLICLVGYIGYLWWFNMKLK